MLVARAAHRAYVSPKDIPLSEAARASYFDAVQGGYKGHMRMWTEVVEIAEEGIPKKVLEGVK